VKVLGTSVIAVGLIEGVAEGAAMVTKLFSGVIADHFRRIKLLAVLGYGLSAFSKPLFPIASGLGLLVTARFMDRIGKGVRGAPRDALVATLSPIHQGGMLRTPSIARYRRGISCTTGCDRTHALD